MCVNCLITITFRWDVHCLSSNDTIHTNDKLQNCDLLKPNSTIVNCLSNIKTTTENHFQVNIICYY